jgi:adenosylhomocysteinase
VQALALAWLAARAGTLAADVHEVPAPLDAEAARLELAAIGVRIDALTPAQSAYLDSWRIGS